MRMRSWKNNNEAETPVLLSLILLVFFRGLQGQGLKKVHLSSTRRSPGWPARLPAETRFPPGLFFFFLVIHQKNGLPEWKPTPTAIWLVLNAFLIRTGRCYPSQASITNSWVLLLLDEPVQIKNYSGEFTQIWIRYVCHWVPVCRCTWGPLLTLVLRWWSQRYYRQKSQISKSNTQDMRQFWAEVLLETLLLIWT